MVYNQIEFGKRLTSLLDTDPLRDAGGFKLTLKSISEHIGIEANTLLEWRAGRAKAPNAVVVTKICNLYGVTIDWLLVGKEPKVHKPMQETLIGKWDVIESRFQGAQAMEDFTNFVDAASQFFRSANGGDFEFAEIIIQYQKSLLTMTENLGLNIRNTPAYPLSPNMAGIVGHMKAALLDYQTELIRLKKQLTYFELASEGWSGKKVSFKAVEKKFIDNERTKRPRDYKKTYRIIELKKALDEEDYENLVYFIGNIKSNIQVLKIKIADFIACREDTILDFIDKIPRQEEFEDIHEEIYCATILPKSLELLNLLKLLILRKQQQKQKKN